MTVPVLDWRQHAARPEAFAEALGAACRGPGFFMLEGHDIPQTLLDEVFAAGDAFFAQPAAEKAPLSILKNPHNRGWAAEGSERLDPGSGLVDRKEAFNIGLDLAPDDPELMSGVPFRGVNVWPDLPGFRATTLAYYDAALEQGRALLGAVARDLGLDAEWFAPHFTAPMATLRLLSYAPASGATGEIGAGAHTDYGALTLLATDDAAGLQLKPRGRTDWIDVPHVPGALVVNIGDCLERWTNGLYRSTPHRVRPPDRARRSVAFFLDPNPGSVIEALPGTGTARQPPITAAAHLRSRLEATYGPGDPA